MTKTIKAKGCIISFKHTPIELSLSVLEGAKFDKTTNAIVAGSDSNYRVHYAQVIKDCSYKISASNSQSKGFYVGFTANIPSVGEAVTNVDGDVVTSYNKAIKAPYNGYIAIYKYVTNFTDLSVKK